MTKSERTKVMLHIIMPNQVSGPNTASRIIAESYLSESYDFQFLTQHKHAGGKVNFSLIKDLIKQIKEFNPQIIHLTGLQGAGFHAVIAAKLCKKKVILAVRGSSIDALNISTMFRFVFGRIIEPLTLRLADKVYTVCQAMERRAFIQKHTKRNLIGTIHNSAPNISQYSIQKYNIREKFGVDPNEIIVVIVGRMIYDKGVTYIIDAIEKIRNEKIKFIFIGDEPKNKDIFKKLQDEINIGKVLLLGNQKKDNVLSILSESDIFLFATLHENLSNALLEACALGLAVIATDVGGNPEVVQHNINGILIPPANSDKIREAIIFLIDNKDVRCEFGKEAKKTVETKFSQDYLLRKLENVYIGMLES